MVSGEKEMGVLPARNTATATAYTLFLVIFRWRGPVASNAIICGWFFDVVSNGPSRA